MTLSMALATQNLNRVRRNRYSKKTTILEINNVNKHTKKFSFIINRYKYICSLFKK